MKLTKEDYMKLGLERCVELLVEKDEELTSPKYTFPNPTWIANNDCPYGGKCYNTAKNCLACSRSMVTVTYCYNRTFVEDSV